jgi:3-oxoacyl-[acyl-carrier protein] reductase
MTLAIRIRATLPAMLVVVTGAGSGIGRAAVHRFAQTGARVLAADLDFQKAHETCVGLPHATPHKADVTKREDVEALVAKHDQIDVYFNNAGIPETVKPLSDISRSEWDTVLDVNLTSLFIAAQVAAPKLKGGVLIQTGSIIANRPRAGLAAYVAAKSGVIGLARALAAELAPDVRVNVINPGPANTPMLGGFGFDADVAEALPLKRLIEPEDIADAAVYLATATAVTGAVFNIDAGRDL